MDFDTIIILGNLQHSIMNNELLIIELKKAKETKRRLELIKELGSCNFNMASSMRLIHDLSNLNQKLNNVCWITKESSLDKVKFRYIDYERLTDENKKLKERLINL